MMTSRLLRRTFELAGVLLSSVIVSCGAQVPQGETQGLPFFQNKERILYSKSETGKVIPERVSRFLHSAHSFGESVRRYSLGSYQRTVTDCSGFIGQAHRGAGYGVLLYQFDYDRLNFTSCTGGLKAGDVVLLAYPGRQPDHWIVMADVKDPQGKFHSGSNIIMDVSSDYVDGRPYYRGELSRRRNLLARQVYACRRHRAFEKDWKQLAVQLEEESRKEAEAIPSSKVPTTEQNPEQNLEQQSEPLTRMPSAEPRRVVE
jgi:hypothetical protein